MTPLPFRARLASTSRNLPRSSSACSRGSFGSWSRGALDALLTKTGQWWCGLHGHQLIWTNDWRNHPDALRVRCVSCLAESELWIPTQRIRFSWLSSRSRNRWSSTPSTQAGK